MTMPSLLRFMTADASPSADREVRSAVMLVVVAALALLALKVVEYFDASGRSAVPIFWGEVGAGLVIVVAAARSGPLALAEMRGRRFAVAGALEARGQVETLFTMTDMLQSAMSYADADAVLRATAARLLPGFGGALYVFNNSGDRLELSTVWGWPEDSRPSETISPPQCWALKRGKPHLNTADHEALRCEHHDPVLVVFEIPMIARGEVFGLLTLQAGSSDAELRLAAAGPVAAAMADAMSLAISNIALRDKLRTQALRDPLTGLYNRRYMEDVLERYANLAERNGSALSAVMIDLDHFKRLNDEHGHAVGDAILCEVAAATIGAIRPCDVACRFGGEELVVLLPDCGLNEALTKAETLRARIENLSDNHGFRITASFGVATIPQTSARIGDLLANADTALYQAKSEGRNRVVASRLRSDDGPELELVAAE